MRVLVSILLSIGLAVMVSGCGGAKKGDSAGQANKQKPSGEQGGGGGW